MGCERCTPHSYPGTVEPVSQSPKAMTEAARGESPLAEGDDEGRIIILPFHLGLEVTEDLPGIQRCSGFRWNFQHNLG